MTIYFVTRQSEIGHLMANLFPEHICLVFSSLEYFTITMQSLNTYPDLIVADYLLLNHDVYNIYTESESKKAHVPVIFYNDPCLCSYNYSSHWVAYLTCVPAKFSLEEINKFKDIFDKLGDFVENPEYAQYISLMQKPKPLPKSMYITKFYEPENYDEAFKIMKIFQQTTQMPQSLFNILEILFQRPDEYLSFNEIKSEYTKQYKAVKTESLKTKLSKLINFLDKQKNPPFMIVKKKDSYRILFLS